MLVSRVKTPIELFPSYCTRTAITTTTRFDLVHLLEALFPVRMGDLSSKHRLCSRTVGLAQHTCKPMTSYVHCTVIVMLHHASSCYDLRRPISGFRQSCTPDSLSLRPTSTDTRTHRSLQTQNNTPKHQCQYSLPLMQMHTTPT